MLEDHMSLYLILHKVRGKPTFDIATRVQIGNESGWIIPTSGHRAWPLRHWPLEDLRDSSPLGHDCPASHGGAVGGAAWADLPDHYELRKVFVDRGPVAEIDLEELGL
jgi:hypothetical protein